MNLNDMIRLFKEYGNHMLVNYMESEFQRDEELKGWRKYFEALGGFSQNAWYPMWFILIKELDIENFLDIGVHVGQFSILSQLLARRHQKEFVTTSVSPFDGTGDKYSNYEQKNYLEIYNESINYFKLDKKNFMIFKSLSNSSYFQDFIDIHKPKYQMMYIDGSHDYKVVKHDIETIVFPCLDNGGIVIFDDANFYTPWGQPPWAQQGYQDVVRAVTETMDDNQDFQHLFDLTHNRVFRRK